MRRTGLAVAALAALTLGGCSAASLGSSSRDEGIEEMKQRILELERQARMAEVEIERLRRQVARLEAGGAPSEVAAAAPERRGSLLPEATARAEPPPERADEDPPVESSELALENRLEEPAVRAAPPAAAAGREEGAAPREAEPVSGSAQSLYDRGYTFYHQGRLVDAEAAFQQFLQLHGGTELADNASYWIGEARFSRGDVEGSLAAFRETFERFPRGNKVPDAMLRAGDCLAQLGDAEGARAQYAEVARRFPNTAAAAMAEERGAKLR